MEVYIYLHEIFISYLFSGNCHKFALLLATSDLRGLQTRLIGKVYVKLNS